MIPKNLATPTPSPADLAELGRPPASPPHAKAMADSGFVFTGPASLRVDRERTADVSGRALPQVPAALRNRQRQAAERAMAKAANGASKAGRAGARTLEQRILDRASLGWNLAEQEQIETLGVDAYLERQLDPESIDDFGLEDAILEVFPSLSMTPAELQATFEDDGGFAIAFELFLATLYRHTYSPRQLYERMVVFWTDHFNISLFSDFGPLFKPTDDREVIRRHALGKFPDMLRASAKSPAMLSYLTNDSNFVGHPNENYARELMELHTMGVDGGYTETDVKEVARCLTGWLYYPPDFEEFGQFLFYPPLHDDEAKTVLGRNLPAGQGIGDGEAVLDILATHPSTARFVSRKLLRYFWGYEPGDAMVDKIAAIYQETGGDIPSMLRGVFRWHRMASATPKVKRPLHLVTSAMRALFAGLENPFYLIEVLLQAGHLPYTWAPPNGFPDSEGYWSGFVLPRYNFATTLLRGNPAPATVDLPFLDPAQSPEELTNILDVLLLNQTMEPATRTAVTQFLNGPRNIGRVADAISLVIASPEFQRY